MHSWLKIAVRIANEQRISTSKTSSPNNVLLGQIIFTSLSFTSLPHLKCVDFFSGLPTMKELNMSIQSSDDLVLIGDTPFQCESQPRRVSCLQVNSSKMQKILAKATRNKKKVNCSLCHSTLLKSCSLSKRTLVPNWTHNLKSL